jgi:FtsH-binding integral membrane protein
MNYHYLKAGLPNSMKGVSFMLPQTRATFSKGLTFRSSCGSYCSNYNMFFTTLGVLLAGSLTSKTRYSNLSKNESNLVFVANIIIVIFIGIVKLFMPQLSLV